jgi:hypothetical protein
MIDLKFSEEDGADAIVNLKNLADRLASTGRKDEAMRLYMIIQIIASSMLSLKDEIDRLKYELNND